MAAADRHVDYLLIGGSVASASAAATLRQEGASGTVLLVGREPDAPYHRPAAINAVRSKRGRFVRFLP